MTTSIVILCQGEQKRIPDLRTPKQLLRLPACGNTPILDRTIRQIFELDMNCDVTVVGWPHFKDHYAIHAVSVRGFSTRPAVVTLDKPGNSSLRGVDAYFTQVGPPSSDRTVILLGDVIYSWDCLDNLLNELRGTYIPVSPDISPSGGELWGIAWNKNANIEMVRALRNALAKHPQQTIYQPGQMRLWLWELEREVIVRCPVHDYTTDIDLPAHTTPEHLFRVSVDAALDDGAHGVTW